VKAQWKFCVALALLALVWQATHSTAHTRARKELAQTKQLLRKQGFRFETSKDNFFTSAVLLEPAGATQAKVRTWRRPIILGRASLFEFPDLLNPVGTDAAIVLWKESRLLNFRRLPPRDLWPDLRSDLGLNQKALNAFVETANSGPFRLGPATPTTPNQQEASLGELKSMQAMLALRTILALHDGD
jgi:hypothetical protein